MAEELKSLLERIQKDGVEKAQAEAQALIAKAKEEAAEIHKSAQNEAASILRKAEEDAKAFDVRSRKSIEQAARDIVIAVGQSIDATLATLVQHKVDHAMSDDTLRQMLLEVVKAYFDKDGETRIEVMLAPEQKERLTEFFVQDLAEQMAQGLEIKADDGVLSGFRVSQVKDHVEHDLTGEAITQALCTLLRPHVAEIVRSAVVPQEG
ncbi:MAG: hypothetical protein PHF14_11840 [Verrucomicrobiota bacterium]|jgi:V/A-type H+-transporting ATPase subunit E|nr:hypothetical protein [Verrucomicrobiota bacterium]MDD8051184.1 hypothetical protein [Verrucomicrobiota bacterium]MDI9382867.1 hypothetical protein [Verrucomicrobiota bacterium]HCF94391.1 hypothetical protein [Verrucomicrobiota bacterium]